MICLQPHVKQHTASHSMHFPMETGQLQQQRQVYKKLVDKNMNTQHEA